MLGIPLQQFISVAQDTAGMRSTAAVIQNGASLALIRFGHWSIRVSNAVGIPPPRPRSSAMRAQEFECKLKMPLDQQTFSLPIKRCIVCCNGEIIIGTVLNHLQRVPCTPVVFWWWSNDIVKFLLAKRLLGKYILTL